MTSKVDEVFPGKAFLTPCKLFKMVFFHYKYKLNLVKDILFFFILEIVWNFHWLAANISSPVVMWFLPYRLTSAFWQFKRWVFRLYLHPSWVGLKAISRLWPCLLLLKVDIASPRDEIKWGRNNFADCGFSFVPKATTRRRLIIFIVQRPCDILELSFEFDFLYN